MAYKKRKNFMNSLMNLFFLFPKFFQMLSRISHVFSQEAKLAGKNMVMLIILAVFCAFLLLTSWIFLLSILFYFFVYLQLSNMLSAALILLINMLLLAIVIMIMLRLKRRFSFPETRKQLNRQDG